MKALSCLGLRVSFLITRKLGLGGRAPDAEGQPYSFQKGEFREYQYTHQLWKENFTERAGIDPDA